MQTGTLNQLGKIMDYIKVRMMIMDSSKSGWVVAINLREDSEECWMRIEFDSLMVRWYSLLEHNGWNDEYNEPPDIAIAM